MTNYLDKFNELGAILNGHFLLSSGLHSDKYVQCALVLQYPDVCEEISKEIASEFENDKIDVVIGPAMGGITFAYEVARQLGVRGIFAERQNGVMTLRRGFSIQENEKVLIVEDVCTTGGSTKEVIELVKKTGATLCGVGFIIDRSKDGVDFGVRQKSLIRIKVETYEQSECPLCKENIPLVKPGSKKLP